MIERTEYLEQLKRFKDKDLIKVVTGIRRCGKSTLFELFINYLKGTGVKDDQIIIDSLLIKNLNYRTIYFNNNGVIDSYYEGYSPNPEEESYAKRFNIKLTTIKELCTDLDMFKEMMKKKIIQGTPEELSKYGLYYSQISLLEKKLAKKQQI